MSYIQCPNCGRDIHEKTDVCPFCDWIFDSGLDAYREFNSEKVEVTNEKRDMLIDIIPDESEYPKVKDNFLLVGMLLVVLICLVCMVVMYIWIR